MTHEDLPSSRNFSCFPHCQFWAVENYKGGDDGSIGAVFNHEAVHNRQSEIDSQLAEHVCYYNQFCGVKKDDNKGYQALIEASATLKAGGGMSWYNKFILFYRKLEDWSNSANRTAAFQMAENGDWQSYEDVVSAYNASKGSGALGKLLIDCGI